MSKDTKEIQVKSYDDLLKILGVFDENVKILEKEFDVSIKVNGCTIIVNGLSKNVNKAYAVLSKMAEDGNTDFSKNALLYLIALAKEGSEDIVYKMEESEVFITAVGKRVKSKTIKQKEYVDSINKNTIVFGVGPAGTGKTYLAVALAVKAFKQREVNKIILTRPAVEAGEKLGFLPGDLQEKTDPYLRPLYDALNEFFGQEKYLALMEKGIIEIAPLAYMRGRTLTNAFVILDEAQNSTKEQMKMFLTRLGEGSKMVITGDITQIDLPYGKESGLIDAIKVLQGIENIDIINFKGGDVVRNPLVSKIVEAYNNAQAKKEKED